MITLRKTWAEYQTVNAANIKEKTRKDYHSKLNKCVGDWLDTDMSKITKSMILTRHRSLSKTPIQANSAMRIVRTLYNFAIERYDDEDENPILKRNPVKTLSALNAWNEEKPRERTIEMHQMKDWINAVLMLDNTTIRDYLLLCLLTGFRHSECAGLKWENVNFDDRTMFIPVTKNGKAHTLPMSNFIYGILQDRLDGKVNDYVFPGGRNGKTGHMKSPHKTIAKVVAASGIKFTPHDLRRTFQDLAEELDIPEHIRKRLMNHARSDVTNKHYSKKTKTEKLREPIERISQFVLKLAELN